jgi:solute carrier family 10 (sodium/bile acid cotransporter), member 7
MIGFGCHAWLAPLASAKWFKTAIVLTVMSMMAAPVPLELFARTVSRPWPGILASIICLAGVPLLGWLAALLLQPELAGGLIVACCVPSTLASSAVITRRAGGDDTVAIFVTLLTNLGCVFVTPLWLVLFMGTEAKFGLADLISELAFLVVLPIVLVQTIRWRSRSFCNWANARKHKLAAFCQVGILMMVMLGSVQMGSRWFDPAAPSTVSMPQLFSVIAIGLAIHLVALMLGWWLAKLTGVARPQAIGVSFSGSQKTLMIGLNLAFDYGVSILPMISYHVSQLLADAFIAEFWAKEGKKQHQATVSHIEQCTLETENSRIEKNLPGR